MNFKNKTTKIIPALLIVSILIPAVFFSLPKQARAIPGACPPGTPESTAVPIFNIEIKGNTGTTCITTVKEWMEYLLKEAGKAIAKAALEKVTQSIVNWINSGFHGSPLFLENPDSFFQDITKFEIKKYVDMFGYDSQRFPFGKQWALNTIGGYKNTVQNSATHTLSSTGMSGSEISEYMKFENGGWNSVYLDAVYPQNSYLGFKNIADSALNANTEAPKNKYQEQLRQGLGFLSPQTCTTNSAYNNGSNEFNQPSFDEAQYRRSNPYNPPPQYIDLGPDQCPVQNSTCTILNPEYTAYDNFWQRDYGESKRQWDEKNTCKRKDGSSGLAATTPGSVVGNQISTALTSHIRNKELSAALGNAFSAIFDALISSFMDKGLNALSGNSNSQPPVDNWSYDGNTLSGSNSNNPNVPGALIVPQNVSVSVGQVTSKAISGGTAPYGIETLPSTFAAVANATISGNTLTITGIAPGQASIIVKDSSFPVKKVTVQITVVGLGGLMVIPANIITDINDQVTAIISGGREPYSMIMGPNETIATVLFRDTILIINGFASGETSFIIKDSSPTPKIVTVNIKITAPTENPTVTLNANPASIQNEESSTLSWTSTNTTSCFSTWARTAPISGSIIVSPISTMTYNITCNGNNGTSATSSVTVNVN